MYTSHAPRASRVLIFCLVGCLVFLFAASAPLSPASASSSSTSRSLSAAVSTSCPSPGTARAASMPSMTLGTHATIVYIVNESTAGTLKRYDVVTGAKVEIVKLANTSINSAQLSANGQWLLFVSGQPINGASLLKLQLVRMDGQYLQTLYCSSAQQGLQEVQWSTNRALIAFVVISNATEHVNVLNTTDGSVQALYSTPTTTFVNVRTWLDLHRLYLTNTQVDQPANTIYLLDVNHPGTLQTVFNGAFSDLDSSYNSQSLYLSHCVCGFGNQGPGTISVLPATGGQQQTFYSSNADAITSVRAVLPTVLLFIVNNVALGGGGTNPDNGLWKVNTNGTGVTRLTTNKASQYPGLNEFSQFPWSNVSRDGTKYVLQILTFSSSSTTYTMEYGSLQGGSPVVFASITSVQLLTVGWTTM